MVSERKLAANRQNAQLSTGPKDTSLTRYNATSHGVFSHSGVIEAVDGEGAQDIYADLERRKWRELAPVGFIEEEYAMQVVDVIWRRRRLMRWETATIQADIARYEYSINKKAQQSLPSPPILTMLAIADGVPSLDQHGSDPTSDADGKHSIRQDRKMECPRAGVLSDPELNIFLRYDTYLSNKLAKICRELHRLQSGRSGGPSRTTCDPDSASTGAPVGSGESPLPPDSGVTGSPSASSKPLSYYLEATGRPTAAHRHDKGTSGPTAARQIGK